MKRVCLLLLVSIISLGAFAQGNKKDKGQKHGETHNMNSHIDSEAHAMMYADKVTTRLNLSLEQKEQIQQAQMKRLESQKEMMAESGNMGANYEEKKKARMKIQEDFRVDMREILSSAQYQEWEPMYEREMKMEEEKKYKDKTKNKAKNKNKQKDEDSDY